MSSLCGAAVAVVIHLASIHSQPGFNNANYGIGASCRVTDSISVDAGVYKNSFDKSSAYLAGEYRWNYREWAVGVVLGAATGYPYGGGVVPVGGLVLHTPSIDGWSGAFLLGPKGHSNGAHVLHFMIAKEL